MAIFVNKDWKNKLADASGLPKDVVLKAPIVTITGQMEVTVENYRGILEYTDQMVRIQTKIGRIKIIGKRLLIPYYTEDEMKITGYIIEIEYQ